MVTISRAITTKGTIPIEEIQVCLLANVPSIFRVKHDTGKIGYQWEREKCMNISNGRW